MIHERLLGVKMSWQVIFIAGLAGGLAEVIGVAAYSAVNGVDGWQVARAISATVSPAWAEPAAAPMIGIGIHFLLSFPLAGVFIFALWIPHLRRRGAVVTLVAGLLSLALVWVFNFFVVLPALHSPLVSLLPYAVTLISKLLFGLALSTVLIACASTLPAMPRADALANTWAT